MVKSGNPLGGLFKMRSLLGCAHSWLSPLSLCWVSPGCLLVSSFCDTWAPVWDPVRPKLHCHWSLKHIMYQHHGWNANTSMLLKCPITTDWVKCTSSLNHFLLLPILLSTKILRNSRTQIDTWVGNLRSLSGRSFSWRGWDRTSTSFGSSIRAHHCLLQVFMKVMITTVNDNKLDIVLGSSFHIHDFLSLQTQ